MRGYEHARLDALLKGISSAADERHQQRDELMNAFERARPNLERAAAAGDAEAADLLAAQEAWAAAQLAFVPSPDRPDYVALEWVLPGN